MYAEIEIMKEYFCTVQVQAFAQIFVEAESQEAAEQIALKRPNEEYTIEQYTIEPQSLESIEPR